MLALVLSQLSIAAHQFEHTAVELDEDCAVCLILDANDGALACAAATDQASTPADLSGIYIDNFAPNGRISSYAARASP